MKYCEYAPRFLDSNAKFIQPKNNNFFFKTLNDRKVYDVDASTAVEGSWTVVGKNGAVESVNKNKYETSKNVEKSVDKGKEEEGKSEPEPEPEPEKEKMEPEAEPEKTKDKVNFVTPPLTLPPKTSWSVSSSQVQTI
jgi:hypothetical protein